MIQTAKSSLRPGLGLSSYGDSAGGKVQSVLSPVGKPLGAGLNQVAAPLGAIIGSVVDKGIMQGGEVAGAISGKGAGNMNMENMQEGWKRTLEEKKQDDALHEPLGGEEPSGENPLGL